MPGLVTIHVSVCVHTRTQVCYLLNCKAVIVFWGETSVFYVEHCNMKEVRASAESKEPDSFICLLKENTLGVEW